MTGVRSHEAGGAGREATAMRIAAPQGNDDQAWVALRSALWPNRTRARRVGREMGPAGGPE